MLLRKNRDPVAGRMKRVEIVRDEEDGKAQRFLEIVDEFVEGGGTDGVEARRRLVEDQHVGVVNQRLRMPPESSEG